MKKEQKENNQLFELSWSWYEDYSYYLFTHSNKTQEQFRKDVKTLLRKYGDAYLKQEKSWAGANDWIRYISGKMPELGYVPVSPVVKGFFGAYIIDGGKSDEDKEWGKIVGKDLLNKAVEHNKKLRVKMDKHVKKFMEKNKSNG